MTVRTPPSWLQAGSHPAEQDRHVTMALLRSPITAFSGGVSAVDPGHGAIGATDLAVSQNGTPNMSVNVAAGMAFIRGTQSAFQGVYQATNDATVNLSIATADATNPRRDLIILQVRDAAYSGASNDARLVVVTGTPAASPSDPSLSSYPNALVLARVAVAAGATSIVTGNITDLRTFAGIPPLTTSTGVVAYTSTSNVTSTFRYRRILGTTIEWECDWSITGSCIGTLRLTLPVAIANSGGGTYPVIGMCSWLDLGTGRYIYDAYVNTDVSTSTVEFNYTRGNYTNTVTNTAPVNVGVGDVFHANGRYRAALA